MHERLGREVARPGWSLEVSAQAINQIFSDVVISQRTRSVINLKQVVSSALMNTVSNSWSVYHGPPVTSTDGSRCESMNILRVGNLTDFMGLI